MGQSTPGSLGVAGGNPGQYGDLSSQGGAAMQGPTLLPGQYGQLTGGSPTGMIGGFNPVTGIGTVRPPPQEGIMNNPNIPGGAGGGIPPVTTPGDLISGGTPGWSRPPQMPGQIGLTPPMGGDNINYPQFPKKPSPLGLGIGSVGTPGMSSPGGELTRPYNPQQPIYGDPGTGGWGAPPPRRQTGMNDFTGQPIYAEPTKAQPSKGGWGQLQPVKSPTVMPKQPPNVQTARQSQTGWGAQPKSQPVNDFTGGAAASRPNPKAKKYGRLGGR